MAYPTPTRSLNGDLFEGMTDGKYKKLRMNRGGTCEELTYQERRPLNDIWYGIHEIAEKVLPDGRIVRTPNYEVNRGADLLY